MEYKRGQISLCHPVTVLTILCSICIQDYDVLNHKMLTTLIHKVKWMEKNRSTSWDTDDMDEDDDIIWSKWITTDITEEVGKLEDPDYFIQEEVGENSITTSSNARRYNLRRRH